MAHARKSRGLTLVGAKPAEPADDAERLYRRFGPTAFKLALRYSGGDRAWAEDVVQDVFLEVHQDAARIVAMKSPRGWIYRATTNRCLKRLRRERLMNSPVVRWWLGGQVRATPDPETLGAARQELGRAFEAVSQLPPRQQVAFWMHHVDGLSQARIGQILGVGKSSVCRLLQRAEATLDQQLGGDDA
ncbi:MAG: sigma-70 family RNA polymerase sigma factor [Myxococcota bacterium]